MNVQHEDDDAAPIDPERMRFEREAQRIRDAFKLGQQLSKLSPEQLEIAMTQAALPPKLAGRIVRDSVSIAMLGSEVEDTLRNAEQGFTPTEPLSFEYFERRGRAVRAVETRRLRARRRARRGRSLP